MANELYIYAKPGDTVVELLLDNGARLTAGTTSANGRDDAHCLQLPSGVSGQGGVLSVAAPGRVSQRVRGIALPSDGGAALFVFDDFGELAAPPPPPEPEPLPPGPPDPENPEAIIHWVYETGGYNLATHDGCGQFTEGCCAALHDYNNATFGHILKNPGQNQYVGPSGKGHAVDALQCLGGPCAGIWDIVHDSVSPNATPAWNYKGPADPALWYYPA
jgi:hypothetical protein